MALMTSIRGRIFKVFESYGMRADDGEYIDINEVLKPFEGKQVKITIEEVADG